MKIALISVAPPYRGGISKHTSILIDKLIKKHTVDLINYSRQYPNFIFPGKSQYLDINENNYPSKMLIDSINPFSWLRTGYKLAKNEYDLIIFRFWHPFFAPSLGIIAGIIKRKSPAIKLISLCDNIFPHEKTPMAQFFTEFLFNKLDGHIVQSSSTEKELHQIITTPIYEKCFHPLYSTFSKKIDKNGAREKLKLKSNNIILYFGIIRDYKGFDILLHSISKLKNKQKDFHLLAAGECYGNNKKYTKLISELDILDYITWHNRYIPDEDVSIYFSAADIVALPYRSASQSGIAQIAYSYDIPVIVTNVGGLPEIVDENKSGFIVNPEDPSSLADILSKNLGTKKLNEMTNYIQKFKHKYSWDKFVEGIESIYSKI